MWAIFKRILKERRIILLTYSLSGAILIWMFAAFFPAIEEQASSFEELAKVYPEGIMKAFNIDINSFTTIEGFLAGEQFSFTWPIMLMFMLIGYAGSAFAGDIERGTIEITLSQPISRLKIFLGRYFAGLFMLIIFVILSILSAIPIISAYGFDYSPENVVTLAILGFMFGLAIYSFSMLVSVIFSDKGKAFFISGIVIVGMYILNIIASIKENLVDLKYGSFFYYFNQNKALIYNEIDDLAYWVFLGVTLFSFVMAAIWFSRRDIAT